MKKTILITGAAGNIGYKLINGFEHKYDLVLLDKKKLDDERFLCCDLSYYDQRWTKYFEKISTAIHLAANPHADATWEQLIPDNVDSVLNVCEACTDKKVERLIFASSCHTMKGYFDKKVDLVTTDMTPLPEDDYGISKLIGERICKSYSEKHSFSVICLRIGWVPRESKKPKSVSNPWLESLWLSTPDLIQVFKRAIEVEDIKYEVLFAMSANTPMKWDLDNTIKTLKYAPKEGLQ
jgi:nucleoside-diphosphate-sugar epimerase